MPSGRQMTASEHEESWEAKWSWGVCHTVSSRPWDAVFVFHPRKQQGPFVTLGGKGFIFICWDRKVTHLWVCKVSHGGIWLCQLQWHEGGSAQPRLFLYCPAIPFDYNVPVKIWVWELQASSRIDLQWGVGGVAEWNRAQKYVWWITVMPVVCFEYEELGTSCPTWRWKGHTNKDVNDLNQQGMAEEKTPHKSSTPEFASLLPTVVLRPCEHHACKPRTYKSLARCPSSLLLTMFSRMEKALHVQLLWILNKQEFYFFPWIKPQGSYYVLKRERFRQRSGVLLNIYLWDRISCISSYLTM